MMSWMPEATASSTTYWIVGLSTIGAWLYQQAGQKTPVVVVAAAVHAGHPLTRADLSTLDVAGAVTAISADHLDDAVGLSARLPRVGRGPSEGCQYHRGYGAGEDMMNDP